MNLITISVCKRTNIFFWFVYYLLIIAIMDCLLWINKKLWFAILNFANWLQKICYYDICYFEKTKSCLWEDKVLSLRRQSLYAQDKVNTHRKRCVHKPWDFIAGWPGEATPYFFSCRRNFSRLCTNHFWTCRSVRASFAASWLFWTPEMKLFSRNFCSNSLRMASLNLRTRNLESNIVSELFSFGSLATSGLGMYGDEDFIWYLFSSPS